ncbi:MAG TPA: methylenetetrahydrofolate--tRNA-(uracil(54)-C(5))-methyltransferase (FADH(2)-oxidizing) TrmFO [Syntrophales bacterium]|nr:methylenetetrahydrofolate--tRNA-(uracil(54)-C(5))-methyltransferase (FADH(2)-oxidizing) TrmFO [Syntrophales bacterium]
MNQDLLSEILHPHIRTHGDPVIIIGGGLAGCEAAWQISRRGIRTLLYEMKPTHFSPAHTTDHLAELVCSNSFRSNAVENAVGLLKEEMRLMGSLIMEAADATAVPAGKALAVDRTLFSHYIEDKLASTGLRIVREEVTVIPKNSIVIIATGPLTSDSLAQSIASVAGDAYLYFYDAISPIVDARSIDYDKVFRASRYGSNDEVGDYLNCPMTRDEYERFWSELSKGIDVPLRDFEDRRCFEGCLPVEVMARRGIKTLLFGPMKPVGLIDPKTEKRPYAVVQLRHENSEGTLYNLVGFQTKLTWTEQKRILRMIPGLENAEFARYGSIHRNTFINSPLLLKKSLQLRSNDNIFIAGQISGVEGYVESAAMGLLAGINVCRHVAGTEVIDPPATTAMGALVSHITNADYTTFQPMNVNFGLFPSLESRVPKKMRGRYYAERSLNDLKVWKEKLTPSGLPSGP